MSDKDAGSILGGFRVEHYSYEEEYRHRKMVVQAFWMGFAAGAIPCVFLEVIRQLFELGVF